jgi:hypothetical protein
MELVLQELQIQVAVVVEHQIIQVAQMVVQA